MVSDKKIMKQFIFLTFAIAYSISGIMIFFSQYGYSVYSWVNSLQEFVMNIPFAIYILSPAIASYFILKKNNKITGIIEWLKTVFYYKNNIFLYLFVFFGLALYILLHLVVAGTTERVLPFYLFFLSIPGNLIIGGLEETGWMHILQPGLERKYGFVLSALFAGLIWLLWHLPLFFIAGTGHYEGYIDFWMFSVQILSFRFFLWSNI